MHVPDCGFRQYKQDANACFKIPQGKKKRVPERPKFASHNAVIFPGCAILFIYKQTSKKDARTLKKPVIFHVHLRFSDL
jgi:hypothetical protein